MNIANSIKHISGNLKAEKLFWGLLLLWIACDIFQAIYMEVMSDEAYYALYGQHMAWGYYDHPPMVAVLNHLSAYLFPGNLSVRFMNVMLHAGTICFMWKLLPERKNVSHVLFYFLIAFSFVMFSAYGFITTPDGALLFFASAFLYSYQKFLSNESWLSTIGLMLAMTGMCYSKYHAVLVVGFVVLSNLSLLRKPKFWISILVTAVLFLPHIYWQVSNNFPSFKYHLIGRNQGVNFINILKYLPEQLFVFNPVALVGVVYILIKKKPEDLFERALYFLTVGILVFFQFMALKGRVEAHWTVVATIPMILLIYNYSLREARFRNIILKGSLCILPIIVMARIILAIDILPRSLALNGKKKDYLAIEKVAGSLPVVFGGSFQDPSLYHFFTGKRAFVLSSIPTRTTQFDLWGFDKQFQDSAVFVYTGAEGPDKYEIEGNTFHGFHVDHLQTTNQVKITYTPIPDQVRVGDTLRMRYTITNPYLKDIDMNHPELPVEFCGIFNGPNWLITTSACRYQPDFKILKSNETIEGKLEVVVPAVVPSAVYIFSLALKTPISIPYNSTLVNIHIFERNR